MAQRKLPPIWEYPDLLIPEWIHDTVRAEERDDVLYRSSAIASIHRRHFKGDIKMLIKKMKILNQIVYVCGICKWKSFRRITIRPLKHNLHHHRSKSM